MDGSQETTCKTNRKRKNKTLTLVEKVRVIEDFESGGGTHDSLGRKYGVGSSTITRILQMKGVIRAAVDKFKEYGLENRKTLKEQTFPLLEEALYIWILQQRQSNILLTIDILKTKAEVLFNMLRGRGYYLVQKFSASDGWIYRFKQRFGLRVKAVAGEKASADLEAYLKFKKILQKKIEDMQLTTSQVFNADESALFIKLLATRSVITCTETMSSGRKQNKTRYTFMPCSNIDGSLKLKLLFIGRAAAPRGINIGALPVSYCYSKKAWMTRQLFRQWFDHDFVPAVRKFSIEQGLEPKALLVLDNCTSHYDSNDSLKSDDGLIQVIYLPPNVTSECQPMNQSVINAVKRKYKRKLMLKLVLENEHLPFEERLKKISLQQCISWLAASWDEISTTTTRNSWKKLIDNLPNDAANEDANVEYNDFNTLVASIDNLSGTITSGDDIDLWMKDQVYDADHNPGWMTSEVFTDEEILASILNKNDPCLEEEWLDDSIEDVNNSVDTSATRDEDPDFHDALKSLDCLTRFMQHDSAEVCRLNALRTKNIDTEWLKRTC